jgi:hypothetical protein
MGIRTRGPIEQRQLQPFDLYKAAASNPLQVAVQPGRRFNDPANLLFTLRPQPHRCLAFSIEVGLQVAESLILSETPWTPFSGSSSAVHILASRSGPGLPGGHSQPPVDPADQVAASNVANEQMQRISTMEIGAPKLMHY